MTQRNLITDVAGVRVGHAQDARIASGVTAIVFDPAGGGEHGRARRRHRDARERAARPRHDHRAHRCDRARGRFRLRPRRRLRRDGVARRTGPRLCRCGRRGCRSCRARSCSTCSMAATRTGAAIRPTASSAMPQPRPRPRPSHSAAPVPGSAPPPSISKAGSAPPRRLCTASPSARLPPSMPLAASRLGRGPWFWAAPYEQNGEFGGLGFPAPLPTDALALPDQKPSRREHDAGGGGLRRGADQDAGASAWPSWPRSALARAIRPVHTPLDGDLVFAAATGSRAPRRPDCRPCRLGSRGRRCRRPAP